MKFIQAIVVGVVLTIVMGVALPVLASDGGGGVQTVEGSLSAVDVSGKTVTVNGQSFSVIDAVDVQVGDTHTTFDQLSQYIGKNVELKLDASDLVFKIEVKDSSSGGGGSGGEEHDVKGTLSAVNAASLTIAIDGQTFPVKDPADIQVDNVGSITLDQLSPYIGRFVEAKVDASNTVVKIDVADGTAGDDHLNGGNGDDNFNGGGGNDTINGGKGNDHEDGGNGDDDLNGDDGNDTLIGGPGNDQEDGGNGDDNLEGDDGNDTLRGGAGNDHLDGGNGDDNLAGDDGNDTVDGGPGDDSIDGGNGDDNLTGGDGNDTIKGGPGNDVINGDSNNSSTPTPAIALTQGVIPMATSSRNNDVIDGGDGNDIINGGPGNDIILGGTGDDTIDGGPGNDQIVGGLGKDTINAGDGNDTIWISAGDVPAGQTENIDCGPGRDLVNLRNFPRRTKVAKGQLTDPITGGVYKFVSCERFSQTRNAPPKSAPASTLNEIAQPITVTSGMEASASLVVFDLTGQRVFESEKFSGNVSETLQATNAIANGVYFYVISARNTEGVSMKSKVKKLVIVR